MIKRSLKPWQLSLAMAAMSFAILAPGLLTAQEDLERPPPMPPVIEPTVTIREEEGRRIEEYRLNGQVYMVKVTPEGGITYYYVDADGDGRLELDIDQRALNPVQPVYWKIKEWK